MDKQFEELMREQQQSWAKLEERLGALEKENACLREELAQKAASEPQPSAEAAQSATASTIPQPPPNVQAPGVGSTTWVQPTHHHTVPPQAPAPAPGWVQPGPAQPGNNIPPYAQGGMPPATGQTIYNTSYMAPYNAKPPTAQAPPQPVQTTPTPQTHPPFTPRQAAPYPTTAPQKPKAEMEVRIGRITGIVGLVFILVGVVLGLRYTYMYLLQSDWLRLGIAYLLGVLFLGAGEVLSRKNKTTFSLSLLAGGVGICLATTAAGYFNLRAMPPLAACGICVLVAAVALCLAMIHKSQLIGVFALVGGYMPMLAVDAMLTGPAKIYLLFLNLLVLFLAVNRDWKVLKCLSLACNTAALIYLFALEAMLTGGVFGAAVVWDLVYLLGCFSIYMAVCLLLAVRQKRNLSDLDTVLIGVNTWVHFMLAYWVLTLHGAPRAGGAIALALSAGFWVFARASRAFLPRDHSARGLFYSNSFVLLPIGIALLFRGDIRMYALLGAGAALWCAGIHTSKRWYSRGGGGLFALGVVYFIWRYGLAVVWYPASSIHAVLPFGVAVVLALLPLATLLFKHKQTVDALPIPEKGFWQGYQALVLAAACFYLAWLVGPLLKILYNSGALTAYAMLPRWEELLSAMLLFLLPMALRHIRYIRAKGTTIVAAVYTGLGFLLTTFAYGTRRYQGTAALVLLALLYGIAILGIASTARSLPKGHPIRERWLWALVVTACLLYVTLYLVQRLNVPFNGMLLSVVYLLVALGCVGTGFIKRKTVLRRFGLVLLYLSVTKLFLIDLAFLASGQRIVSYFVFGFALLGISWGYQHYEKQLLKDTNKPE